MTPEEMKKQFGPLDECVDAEDEFEGIELFEPSMWLQGSEDEDEAFSDNGHVYLSRDFRRSGDPAVLLSKTVLAGPEMLAIIEKMLTAWESEMRAIPNAFKGVPDALAIHARSVEARTEAREVIAKLKGMR